MSAAPDLERDPIDFADIKIGDVIEREEDLGGGTVQTIRLTVGGRGGGGVGDKNCARHYMHHQHVYWFLLERPTPPVELPTEPTLGRLTWRSFSSLGGDNGTRTVMAIWQKRESVSGGKHQQVISEEQSFQIALAKVISWEPAVAVPASALDELRAWNGYQHARTFLAAVDHANKATS